MRREPSQALEFRVRGRVQGVGFRPTVWRMARELGLAGEVLNDGEGVLVRVSGDQSRIAALLRRIERDPPPLAHIDSIERRRYSGRAATGVPYRREHRRTRPHPGRAGCGALRRMRGGAARSGRTPLSLSVHQLHPLRTAPQHRDGHSLRPRDDDDGALRPVCGV